MQAGAGLLDMDVMPIFITISLDIVITLRFSINFSTAICSPTVLFSFKREASSETYGSGVYFPSYIFRSMNQTTQKYLAAIYFICDLLFQSITNFWDRYPKGIDNPFNTSGCKYLFFVCRYCLCTVA